MKNITAKILFVGLMTALPVLHAEAICLDYWIKGPAACKEEQDQKNRILIKGGKAINVAITEEDPERVKYKEELDKKIDVFLAGYGKPPREFAAFHLDPTMENAVKWVKKFNEEHERTMKIAVAWKQADYLFRQYKETGEILLPANSGVTADQVKYLKQAFEENGSDLPKVEGFGVDLPGDWDEDRLARDYSKLNYKTKSESEIQEELKSPKPIAIFGESEGDRLAFPEGRAAKKDYFKEVKKQLQMDKTKESGKKEKLEISYYFSAQCPFCEKFKPELQAAIKSYGKENISLTCVDMTPGDRSPKNVKGKIDCKWRPLVTGEQAQFGIKRTPSMIVKRGDSTQLELLENYHKESVLIDYFTNGPKK